MNDKDNNIIQDLRTKIQIAYDELLEDLAPLYFAIWFMDFAQQVFRFVVKLSKDESEELK